MMRLIKEFINSESSGGVVLFVASILSVIIANSSFAIIYQDLLSISLPLHLSSLSIYHDMDLKLWIDDGLMSAFFLLVGLELKREIMVGELSSKSRMIMPLCAAIGGVIIPILIYLSINSNNPQNFRGAAIPAATDIAFAIGVLSLFGNKISNSLKVFLIALAIIDDLIAIIIIAIFYSSNIDLGYLGYASLATILLGCLNWLNITKLTPYLLIAPFLWIFVLKSGIHPTIAGVILAILIPLNFSNKHSKLKHPIETYLHFPVYYLILPIFAFANSGVVLSNFSAAIFTDELIVGIMFGLFFGKQIGISLAVYLLHKFKLCQFFKNVSWLEFYGITIIAGIGFTMSLFIGNLAFASQDMIEKVRMGVICGSCLSIIFGMMVLQIAIKLKKNGLLASR